MFVEFKINPKENIKHGKVIPNRANIVFYIDEFFTTNTVQNTIKYSKKWVLNKLVIHPNPSQYFTKIIFKLSI